jgi:hypothetical protein
MFLVNRELGPEQFLKALNFIPPKGTKIAYFISPKKIDVPSETGYVQQKIETPEDESIAYFKTEPIMKVDQATSPGDYSQWEPEELKRRQPTPNVLPTVTEPEDLESPFIKIINENEDKSYDLKLLENYGPFLRNTIFHCQKLKEEK